MTNSDETTLVIPIEAFLNGCTPLNTEVIEINPEIIEAAPAPSPEKQHIKISARGLAVDQNYFLMRIDAETPRGVKLQLYSRVAGTLTYGAWDGKSTFYTHWAPLPKLPEGEL